LRKYCALDQQSIELLKDAVIALNLSARAYDRILRAKVKGKSLDLRPLERKIKICFHVSSTLFDLAKARFFALAGGMGSGQGNGAGFWGLGNPKTWFAPWLRAKTAGFEPPPRVRIAERG
jgi:hypothetical protein